MKMAKRILSLVLVLVMFASLSVTAFADTPATPYVQVTVENSRSGATDSWTVAATTGKSVEFALEAQKGTFYPDWDPVADYYDPSITHDVLTSYGRVGGTMFEKAGFDKSKATDVALLIAAGYDQETIDGIQWCTGEYQGYGLVDEDEAAGTYTYIYAGYDWTYSSTKSAKIWDYMCCYNVQADEIIYLKYGFNVTEEWTQGNRLARLSEMQDDDGGFSTTYGDGKYIATSESTAQVLTALSALGIDGDTDSRFVKNGSSVVDALLRYYVKGGGFKHIMDGEIDGMGTEQSYYALTAYYRFLSGKTNLYDMTDIIDMGGDVVTVEPTVPAATEPAQANTPWWIIVVCIFGGVGWGIVIGVVLVPKLKKKD